MVFFLFRLLGACSGESLGFSLYCRTMQSAPRRTFRNAVAVKTELNFIRGSCSRFFTHQSLFLVRAPLSVILRRISALLNRFHLLPLHQPKPRNHNFPAIPEHILTPLSIFSLCRVGGCVGTGVSVTSPAAENWLPLKPKLHAYLRVGCWERVHS